MNNFPKEIIVIDYNINIDKVGEYLSGKGQLLH